MTSRERVSKVLRHEIPDRVPNGLGGSEVTGMHVLSYDKLQNMLDFSGQAPRINTFMTNAVFEKDIIKAMEGDILLIASPNLCKGSLRGKNFHRDWKKQEIWGKTFRIPVLDQFEIQNDGSMLWKTTGLVCPKDGFFFDYPGISDLFEDFMYPDPENYNPSDSFSDEFLRELEATAKSLYEETEYSLSLGESVTDLQFQPGGRLGWMVLLKENPDLMMAYLDKACTASLKQIFQLDQAVGKYVDMMLIADDIGDNRGVGIGDQTWREIYKPFYKCLFHGWHERTNMKINFHCCGSIFSILDDLIECGIDILNPVQISAENMDPQMLKNKFGTSLVFYGGDYDAQMMKRHSHNEVYEHVKYNLNTFKNDGGHIFSGVHNLPPDIPEEHLRAFFTAWKENRYY